MKLLKQWGGWNFTYRKEEKAHGRISTLPVMLKGTVDGLAIRQDGIYVDCTLGGAGHSEYLLSQLSEEGPPLTHFIRIKSDRSPKEAWRLIMAKGDKSRL